MTEEIKLKPCPFCGGEAEIIDDAMGTISRCRRCGAEIVFLIDRERGKT